MAKRNIIKGTETEKEVFTPSVRNTYLERGREKPDGTPVAPPVGYVKQPSLAEQIRNMVRSERLRQEAESAGFESFEDADDFEVGDDYEPSSPYEYEFDPEPVAAPAQPAQQQATTETPPSQPAPAAPAPEGSGLTATTPKA